ncbi:hypothetical protein GCM10009592_05390 [Brachybacterium rhamnosum]|uniref:Uncharacterized protein n=1 Tax=Brachybacterium rhamnosum TaxID=173361 RepID=A0ABW4PTQ4_9MICO
MSTTQLSRRALVRGAAWTLPTAVAATAAPAVAASAACPSTVAIDALFAARQQEVSAYDGCAGTTRPTFTIGYDGPGGVNGYLQNVNINVRNQNPCAIDTTAYPLAFRVDIVNLSGPDRNPGGATTLQRSITATNSDGYLSRLSRPGVRTSGVKTESTWEAVGSETVAGASRTVHSARWNVVRACSVNAGEDMDLQISWADGCTSSGRLTDAVRLVPLSMAAPQWAEVTDASSAECASAYAHDAAKVQQWYANGDGCSPNIRWEVAPSVTTTRFSTTSGYIRTPISCGTGLWSSEAKVFTPTHDGIY